MVLQLVGEEIFHFQSSYHLISITNISSNIFQRKDTSMRRWTWTHLNHLLWHQQYPETNLVLPKTSYNLPWHDMKLKNDTESFQKSRNKYCYVKSLFTNWPTTRKTLVTFSVCPVKTLVFRVVCRDMKVPAWVISNSAALNVARYSMKKDVN